jgi:putative endonuclease
VRGEGCLPKLYRERREAVAVWYVYFLQLSNDDIYVGSTNDLKRRLSSHQAGQVISTKAYLPATLKSYVAVETEAHARELEIYFKSGSGKAVVLKRLIRRGSPAR